jgi:hypothetical protein
VTQVQGVKGFLYAEPMENPTDFLKPIRVILTLSLGFNQIDLPQYTSYEVLRQQLLMAIK